MKVPCFLDLFSTLSAVHLRRSSNLHLWPLLSQLMQRVESGAVEHLAFSLLALTASKNAPQVPTKTNRLKILDSDMDIRKCYNWMTIDFMKCSTLQDLKTATSLVFP